MRIRKIRQMSWDNLLFGIIVNALLGFLVLVALYPVFFVVVASFSDPDAVNSGKLLLHPEGFNTKGYQRVFSDSRVWIGYANTVFYTVFGTLYGVMLTIMAGDAFSRRDLPGRGPLMKIFIFTMYFGGGLIPTYVVMNNLGLVNTRLLMVMMGSCSVYNMIVARSFMASNIPGELLDAATVDGCGNGRFFVMIVLPLSKAIIAVMVLYVAVGHWNSYFDAMIYLNDRNKYPLQVFLREILNIATSIAEGQDDSTAREMLQISTIMRYSLIVIAMLPITCVYPFIQKYFMKGVMIGSVKG